MPQPFYLPALADIPAKPNIIRAGLPLASGASVNGLTNDADGGPAQYLAVEPIINLGTTACYQFSDPYCYNAGANPPLAAAVALDLSNNQHTCSTTGGPMTYANGGFVFTATNATDGTSTPNSQGITFLPGDLMPAANINHYFLSTIWLAFAAVPAATVNALLFTYPDGSTWSIVNGVFTFTPIGQAAIPVTMAHWNFNAAEPLQLGYSRDPATNGTGTYSVSIYINGQVENTVNYTTAYTPDATPPEFIGFGPNATAAASLAAYTALRLYMEDTTISFFESSMVVGADYLLNVEDITQEMATNSLPSP